MREREREREAEAEAEAEEESLPASRFRTPSFGDIALVGTLQRRR